MCFFFSSRRRHTRYWRDWSSDVCSSDLHHAVEVGRGLEVFLDYTEDFQASTDLNCVMTEDGRLVELQATRSEERRVGKGVDLGSRRSIKRKGSLLDW